MPTDSSDETCRRCGHARRAGQNRIGRLARLATGRKAPRVDCGEPTEHGWACPCRSRFHGR